MATGLALTVVQTLLSALENKELRELCSMFGHESQLVDLQSTVETIKPVLLDAESKHQELSNQGKVWLGKLKDAVYEADDLFDEFTTIAQQQEMPCGKISKKVRRFFSSDNQLLFAANTSRKIKKLREKLDKIAKDRTQFGFSDVYIPVKRREETLSYVHESDIIGRDADREAILDLLLQDIDSTPVDVQDNIKFVSIVGIGGLGKTALAQLVYNDDRIKSVFELSFWVCVSEEFSMEEILYKMLGKSELRKERLLREVRDKIEGRRYFLVLDDVWNESRNEWAKLRGFLLLGARGSRIIVTSRSKKVARAVGYDLMYELQGLSDEYSWQLFERIAFNQRSREQANHALVEIGKDIVKKCANVPLSIRVIGSMLYDQEESKWKSFQKMDLAKMGEGDQGIMPILKFSYYHLTPQLKSCFSYCALFPKDYDINKDLLMTLWCALGCLKPLGDNWTIEDVGEEYFSILSQRCFLQDIKVNGKYGTSCKMHDLIHDLALQVAGNESYLMLETSASPVDGKNRHLSIAFWRSHLLSPNDSFIKMKKLRTFFRPSVRNLVREVHVATMLANCRHLRVLDLHKLSLTFAPSTLCKLSHLRYLDLSHNTLIKLLPDSITKLYNLQVLKLQSCWALKELPKDLRKLVNLRELDIRECVGLSHMPVGMSCLTNLHTLPLFILGEGNSSSTQIGQLKDLVPLINLRGSVGLLFKKDYLYDVTSAQEGPYFLDKERMKILHMTPSYSWSPEDMKRNLHQVSIEERLLERLEPHNGLKEISIRGYAGNRMPSWGLSLGISFPHLVNVTLTHFNRLQRLPSLSQLQHLKYLDLQEMPKVEFMEDGMRDNGNVALPSFPSLEELILVDIPKMKIFPECSHLKLLYLCGLNSELRLQRNSWASDHCFDFDSIRIDNLDLLDTLFGESLRTIRDFTVQNNSDLETLSSTTVVNVYQRHASSIRNLKFQRCPNLKSLSGGGIEYLVNLQKLTIWNCHSLDFEDENAIPWRALHALPHLELSFLPQLINIPEGVQYLTSLQTLRFERWYNLEKLPDWLHCLTSFRDLDLSNCHKLDSLPENLLPSLSRLSVHQCDALKDRYIEPHGKDWLKVSHISDIYVGP